MFYCSSTVGHSVDTHARNKAKKADGSERGAHLMRKNLWGRRARNQFARSSFPLKYVSPALIPTLTYEGMDVANARTPEWHGSR